MKKYKALMLDLDGTTIPTRADAIPSQKVIDSIARANQFVHVGIVTARPYALVKPLLKYLALVGPSIISGGAQIINFPSGEILSEEMISKETAYEICNYLNELKIDFVLQYKGNERGVKFDPENIQKDALDISVPNISLEKADWIIEKLDKFKTVAGHKTAAWDGGGNWVQITSAKATKQHAVLEVAEVLKIQTHEIIGVGDAYNDFPLLMACGLKVAMGNAVPELKEIADYIAPSIDEDGVADVIEKFVLGENKK